MKKITAGLLLLLALVAQLAFGVPTSVTAPTSKHNLSSSGTGSIKSTLETQICVFCHTPHGASTAIGAGPLWNRTSTTATYTMYTSNYLDALLYPGTLGGSPTTPAQPKAKSKLCLSCHDGTIAVGQVLNLPGSGSGGGTGVIAGITNVVGGKMTAANPGFLGIDLTDDHPVGYLYDSTKDSELVTKSAGAWGTAVKLDPDDTATGTLECHTCHNAHDNQFTKFLRMQISDGSLATGTAYLCKHCHNKTGYDLSGHGTSTQVYTQPVAGSVASTVSKNACLNCHKPHGAPSKPVLRGAEEATCYNAGCHGTNNPWTGNATANGVAGTPPGNLATTWRNIQFEMAKASKHPVATAGLHKDLPFVPGTGTESAAQLGTTNRHAECPDCHNPHQVQPAATVEKSTRGVLRISLALKGTWGVQPTTWPTPLTGVALTTNAVTFAAPANGLAGYTVLGRSGTADASPVTDEYQVCLKCHSNYVTLPVGARNIAQEINPGNSSYHGMVPCPNTPAIGNPCTTNYYVNSSTMAQPWGGTAIYVANASVVATPTANSTEWLRQNPPTSGAVYTAYANRGRVWCSDCHGSNAATMPPVAGTKTAPYGPHGSTNVGTAIGTSNSDKMLVKTIVGSGSTPLCTGCHTVSAGKTRGYHGRLSFTEGCFACHMWDNQNYGGSGTIFPHGMNKRWAVRVTGDTTSVMTGQMVDSFLGGWYANINYTTKTCWMAGTSNPCGGRTNLTDESRYGPP